MIDRIVGHRSKNSLIRLAILTGHECDGQTNGQTDSIAVASAGSRGNDKMCFCNWFYIWCSLSRIDLEIDWIWIQNSWQPDCSQQAAWLCFSSLCAADDWQRPFPLRFSNSSLDVFVYNRYRRESASGPWNTASQPVHHYFHTACDLSWGTLDHTKNLLTERRKAQTISFQSRQRAKSWSWRCISVVVVFVVVVCNDDNANNNLFVTIRAEIPTSATVHSEQQTKIYAMFTEPEWTGRQIAGIRSSGRSGH